MFFELHSSATEEEKDKKWVKKGNFLANGKSLNEFIMKIRFTISIILILGVSYSGVQTIIPIETKNFAMVFKTDNQNRLWTVYF